MYLQKQFKDPGISEMSAEIPYMQLIYAECLKINKLDINSTMSCGKVNCFLKDALLPPSGRIWYDMRHNDLLFSLISSYQQEQFHLKINIKVRFHISKHADAN